MAYVQRERSRWQSVVWSLRAARYDGHWWRSFKSIAGAFR
jgi:hypothetical protein